MINIMMPAHQQAKEEFSKPDCQLTALNLSCFPVLALRASVQWRGSEKPLLRQLRPRQT